MHQAPDSALVSDLSRRSPDLSWRTLLDVFISLQSPSEATRHSKHHVTSHKDRNKRMTTEPTLARALPEVVACPEDPGVDPGEYAMQLEEVVLEGGA